MGRLLGVSGRVCWGSIGESLVFYWYSTFYYGRTDGNLPEGVPGVYREITGFLLDFEKILWEDCRESPGGNAGVLYGNHHFPLELWIITMGGLTGVSGRVCRGSIGESLVFYWTLKKYYGDDIALQNTLFLYGIFYSFLWSFYSFFTTHSLIQFAPYLRVLPPISSHYNFTPLEHGF